MKYNSEEWVAGGPDRVGNPFDDAVFSRISEAVDRIQQMSNEMDFIAVLAYNLKCFYDIKKAKSPEGRTDFTRVNCCFSNYMNSFYTWKCFLNHKYDSFQSLHGKQKNDCIVYSFGDRLRNYTAHNAFAITKHRYDVINEKEYYIIDTELLLQNEEWNKEVKIWLNEQAKNDTAIEAYMFASEFYQHCQEVQNELWAEQTQKIHDDLSAIFEILPAGFSNVYNVSILSEDQTVHIGIGQIVAQFLKKAAYQYPKFIPDSYIGRF